MTYPCLAGFLGPTTGPEFVNVASVVLMYLHGIPGPVVSGLRVTRRDSIVARSILRKAAEGAAEEGQQALSPRQLEARRDIEAQLSKRLLPFSRYVEPAGGECRYTVHANFDDAARVECWKLVKPLLLIMNRRSYLRKPILPVCIVELIVELARSD